MNGKEQMVAFQCHSTPSTLWKLATVSSGRKCCVVRRSVCIHSGRETKEKRKQQQQKMDMLIGMHGFFFY